MKVLDEEGLAFYHSIIKGYIDSIYHLRLNKIIKSDSDIMFINPNYHDFSVVPNDNIIATLTGSNNTVFNYILRYTDNKYRLRVEASNGYGEDIYTGSSKSNMNLARDKYVIPLVNGYGDYSKVTFINNDYINIIDNVLKINEEF